MIMVKVYVKLIRQGLKTIDNVPPKWRGEVEKALAEVD